MDVLSKVSPKMVRQAQKEDLEISKVMHYVNLGRKPSPAQIRKLKSKIVCRYLQQSDQFVFIQGGSCKEFIKEMGSNTIN